MGETVVHIRENGKLVIWDEDSLDGWMMVDPDVFLADEDALTGPQTSVDDWRDDDE